MKALFEKVSVAEERTLLVKYLSMPYFSAPLHFHPEFELTFILQGYGQRFVGDNIENFSADDLVLLGSHLPHYWRCDLDFYQKDSSLKAEAIVCQFSDQTLPLFVQKIPEFAGITQLLESAKFGLKFSQALAQSLKNQFFKLIETAPSERLLIFLNILNEISQATDYQVLTTGDFHFKANPAETERMKRILEFTLQHFTEEITLKEVAEVAHLTQPSFCRYFKQRTRKSYFDYLNDLRINYARKLLINSELSVSQIALDSGYQNISHFHSQFKKALQISPLGYRKKYNSIPK
jgi:AraC-like DNA-binding protein